MARRNPRPRTHSEVGVASRTGLVTNDREVTELCDWNGDNEKRHCDAQPPNPLALAPRHRRRIDRPDRTQHWQLRTRHAAALYEGGAGRQVVAMAAMVGHSMAVGRRWVMVKGMALAIRGKAPTMPDDDGWRFLRAGDYAGAEERRTAVVSRARNWAAPFHYVVFRGCPVRPNLGVSSPDDRCPPAQR